MYSSSVDALPPSIQPSLTNHMNFKEHLRCFWTGYQFKCDKQERGYLKRHELLMVKAFQAFGIFRLFLDALAFLSAYFITKNYASVFPVHLFNVVTTITALLLVSCTSRFRKHVVLTMSITSILLAATGPVLQIVHMPSALDHSLQSDFSKAMRYVAHDPDALQELQHYVFFSESRHLFIQNLIFLMPQLLLLVYAGLWRSTIISVLATCIMAAVPWSTLFTPLPNVPVGDLASALVKVGIGVAFLAVLLAYLLGILVTVTLDRRYSFSLETYFQAALETAVAASRQADSILNHTLKNTMADAAGNIEMFLDNVEPGMDVVHLKQSEASLRRGMRACQHRQAYLQLAAQRYQPPPPPTYAHTHGGLTLPKRGAGGPSEFGVNRKGSGQVPR